MEERKQADHANVWAVAREYALLGWRIVPLHHLLPSGYCSCGRGKSCPENSRAKHPIMKGWQNEASADAEVISQWARQYPHANIGVLLGAKSGIIDIEFDDDEGRQTAERLLEGIRTPTYVSGHRSVHRLFRWRDDLPGGAVLKVAGLEIRTGNGAKAAQSVLPPSVHRTGNTYKWTIPPQAVAVAELPASILALIANAEGQEQLERGRKTCDRMDDRELALDALAGLSTARAVGYHDWLHVGMALHSVDSSLLPAWDDWSQLCAEKYTPGACAEKWQGFTPGDGIGPGTLIYWARQDGWQVPWERNGRAKRRSTRPTVPIVVSGDVALSLLCADGRTEVANARRFAHMHGDKYRWCEPWGRGLIWDNRRWAPDLDRRGDALAKEVYQQLWSEFPDSAKESSDVVREILRFVRQTGTAHGIEAMLKLARSERGIPVSPNVLDGDPWLLNVANGTIDLRTGKLREHRREDRITKLCPVTFDLDADCPEWVKFMRDITRGDESLQDYLRKAVGCSLTGDVSEHVLFFCYGSGANGKSTFLNTIADLLGCEFAMKAAPDLLLLKSNDSHPTERADLAGKRFVTCIEAGEGRRMAESLVKEITGGDTIRARRMREDFWQFKPTHKIWLAANHKPNIRGTDEGIWRRIKLIPFNAHFAEEQQDKKLAGKLAAELPGILNWALWGCTEWLAKGLAEPKAVTEATGEYRRQQDVLAAFLDECCDVASGLRETSGQLLNAYRNWSGDERMNARRFGDLLTEKGYDRDRKGGNVYRLGLELKSYQRAGQSG